MELDRDRAVRLLQQDDFGEAESAFRKLLEKDPGDAFSIHYLGLTRSRLGALDEALALIEKSLTLRPDVADFHHNAGTVFRTLGRFDDAEKAYQKAIVLKPDYPEAYFNLSSARRFRSEKPELESIRERLALAESPTESVPRKTLTPVDESYLHFAAGKICDDLGQYGEAFHHYEKGNQLEFASRGSFDRKSFENQINRICSVFSRDFFAQPAVTNPNPEISTDLPVFIVGMPRSGTTLVEQILSSHPLILGAGELRDINVIASSLARHCGGAPYPENVLKMPGEAAPGFARHYLSLRAATTPGMNPDIQRITDKMPSNGLHLGLINLLFSNARIIHCRRDPRDTSLSCFFQRFREGHNWTFNLGTIGFYYRQFERLMNHWGEVLPMRFTEVEYGSLIDNPERTIRGLLEFCEVPWDDSCLRFHENRRNVTTASNWQVRNPLNRRSIERWRNYESFLSPLEKELDCR